MAARRTLFAGVLQPLLGEVWSSVLLEDVDQAGVGGVRQGAYGRGAAQHQVRHQRLRLRTPVIIGDRRLGEAMGLHIRWSLETAAVEHETAICTCRGSAVPAALDPGGGAQSEGKQEWVLCALGPLPIPPLQHHA